MVDLDSIKMNSKKKKRRQNLRSLNDESNAKRDYIEKMIKKVALNGYSTYKKKKKICKRKS